jgi:nitrate reductase NapAB chaperone NapD
MILDRRRFLTGGRPALHAPARRDAGTVVYAVIVQFRPDRSDAVLAAVSADDGITVADRSVPGRVTLALSGRAGDDIVNTLALLSDMPGVVSAMPAPPSRILADEVSA